MSSTISCRSSISSTTGRPDGYRQTELKNSYLRFLRGWMMDSNSVEGAVLKGWVESRMGVTPYLHKIRIPGIHAEEYMNYPWTHQGERPHQRHQCPASTSSTNTASTNCSENTADSHLVLYRGTNDASDMMSSRRSPSGSRSSG